MSTNINPNMEGGGLLSPGMLREKNKNKPMKGQKLSALKDAVTLRKKSADGSSDADEVKLLRKTGENRQVQRAYLKNKAQVHAGNNEIITKEADREEFYASLTKKEAPDHVMYNVDGVRFSAEEMTSIREALGDVLASVKRPGYNLDYSDYAKMGIAENVIYSYAEKNLNEQQTEVIMKAVSEHMNLVIAKEPEASFVVEDQYYGKRNNSELHQRCVQAIKEAAAAADFYSAETKKRIAEMSVDTPSMTTSASNTELATSLRSVFANMDFENGDELQTFFKQYQEWMKPAYLEVHGGSEKFAAEHIAEDIALYKKQYKDLTNSVLAASVTHVNLQI